MCLREIEWEGGNWMHLAQDRDQWQASVNSNEPLGSMKGREFLDWVSDYKLLKKYSAVGS
jgi:hypothetical protein